MMRHAVIDRYEDIMAVLLIGKSNKPMIIERALIPNDVKEGTWLRIRIKQGKIIEIIIDEKTTEARALIIKNKMDRLRKGEHLK